MLICGIDPGTGRSSPTALVIFDPDTKDIKTMKIIDGSKDFTQAIAEVPIHIEEYIKDLPDDTIFYIEKFVMRGKGGETLQKFIGAILHKLYNKSKNVHFVQNTTIKLTVGKHGHCLKEDIAEGVLDWFKDHTQSHSMISMILDNATYIYPEEIDKRKRPKTKELQWGQFDLLDAFAIAITGYKG